MPTILFGKMEEIRSSLKILTGKPTGRRLLGRLGHRWEGNVRMDLTVIVVNTRKWVDLFRDRDYWRAFVNAAMNLRIQ
jgi:hypothetical protein